MFCSPNAALVNQSRSKCGRIDVLNVTMKLVLTWKKMLQKNPRTPKNEKESIGMAFVCDAFVFYQM